MITGTFCTTCITAMETEASIPLIDIWMEHRLEMEALQIATLPRDHPIICCVYPDQRIQPIPVAPLPPFIESRRYWTNLRTKFTTCITHISKWILEETEHTFPNAEPPWRLSEVNLHDRVILFTPENRPGESIKEEWANTHLEFTTEEEGNEDILFVYSDGSLSEQEGRRCTGYGVVGYNQGRKVFETSRAMGKHTEVFDVEMAGLHMVAIEARCFIESMPTENRPHMIVFYANNTGTIQRIFEGSPGKAQAHS